MPQKGRRRAHSNDGTGGDDTSTRGRGRRRTSTGYTLQIEVSGCKKYRHSFKDANTARIWSSLAPREQCQYLALCIPRVPKEYTLLLSYALCMCVFFHPLISVFSRFSLTPLFFGRDIRFLNPKAGATLSESPVTPSGSATTPTCVARRAGGVGKTRRRLVLGKACLAGGTQPVRRRSPPAARQTRTGTSTTAT